MATIKKLLKLAAKIALDFVIAPERVDEAATIFGEWMAGHDAAGLEVELVRAESESHDPAELRQAVGEAVAAAKKDVTPEQQEAVSLSVGLGLAALRARDAEKPLVFEELKKAVLPGKEKKDIIWLDLDAICQDGAGRYCHFFWTGESYRVRDYIGGKIFYPPDRHESGGVLTPVQINMTALQVWQAGKGAVPRPVRPRFLEG
jgi:hypothetical protein